MALDSVSVKFTKKRYTSFLKRLQKFVNFIATVGIHEKEGKWDMSRRYNKIKRNKKTKEVKSIHRVAGKTHRMSLIKVVYQNEFGAVVPIRTRYRRRSTKIAKTYDTPNQRLERYSVAKSSKERGKNEQGYVLISKEGKFVKYYPPGSAIYIPPRPFLQKTVDNISPKMSQDVKNVLRQVLGERSKGVTIGFTEIVLIVYRKVMENFYNAGQNNPVTVEAKGHNRALVDEKNRIAKGIKYKIYRDPSNFGTSSEAFKIRFFAQRIDKLLKSASQYEKIHTVENTTTVTNFEGWNPNFLN